MRNLIIASCILLISCDAPTIQKKTTGVTYGGNVGVNIEEIEYEGCQYIGRFAGSNTDWGSHKGNCTNPIHTRNIITVTDTVEYQIIRK